MLHPGLSAPPELEVPEMSIMDKAKELFTRRGGADAAKQDAQEVRDVAQGDASMGDKAKEGFQAVKDPGAPGEGGEGQTPSAEQGPGTGQQEQR
jgi:hypothetical protein